MALSLEPCATHGQPHTGDKLAWEFRNMIGRQAFHKETKNFQPKHLLGAFIESIYWEHLLSIYWEHLLGIYWEHLLSIYWAFIGSIYWAFIGEHLRRSFVTKFRIHPNAAQEVSLEEFNIRIGSRVSSHEFIYIPVIYFCLNLCEHDV